MMPPDGHTFLQFDDLEAASIPRPCPEPVAVKIQRLHLQKGLFRNWDSLFWTGENKKILINDFLIHPSWCAAGAGNDLSSLKKGLCEIKSDPKIGLTHHDGASQPEGKHGNTS